jgi:hypothetical protein
MCAPSAATLRMRRSRERRRQGDVIVKLEIGPNMTTDLVALGWLATPDRVHKGALAPALVGLINRAITMRVTPSTMESESVCFTPLHVTAGPIAIGFDGNARQSPRLATPSERGGPQEFSLGRIEPDEVFGAADGAAEIVEDKPQEAQPCDGADTPNIAAEQAEFSRFESSEDDLARFWRPRLSLWLGRRIWAPGWGPRPDQDGCLVPDYMLKCAPAVFPHHRRAPLLLRRIAPVHLERRRKICIG